MKQQRKATSNTTGEWHLTQRYERIACDNHPIDVSIRLQGKLRRHRAALLDFNCHGAAIIVPKPLATEGIAFVSLGWRDIKINQLVCNINSCVLCDTATAAHPKLGYRCGLTFRVRSSKQFDPLETQQQLVELESQLVSALEPGGISAISA